MKWRVWASPDGSYWVARKTWHSPEWMGIDKKTIRYLPMGGRNNRPQALEVFAECAERELAERLLRVANGYPLDPAGSARFQ